MEFLSNLSWSAVDPALKATIGTAVLSLLGIFFKWIFTPKSRVKWGVPHQFAFRVKNEQGAETPIKTREVWVQNVGSAPASNVIVCLNFPCQHLEVWPPGGYDIQVTNDGRMLVKIQRLVKREFARVMLYEGSNAALDLPDVLYVKWEEGEAKQVLMGPTQILPPWLLKVLAVLMVLGGLTFIYLCLLGIVLLAA